MLKKFVQKLYKLYIKTIKNTKFVYIFCIQKLYKWWMYKNVQTVENLYKVQTKNGFKLEMYVFCTYTQCTNYIKCIQMLIESYMRLLMYAFCIYKNPIFFTFQISAIFRSILQLCKISRPIFSYSKKFINEFILYIYLVLI